MANSAGGSIVWVLLALVSFTIAFLAASGRILADDVTGRWIYGVGWTLIGTAWLARYLIEQRKARSRMDKEAS